MQDLDGGQGRTPGRPLLPLVNDTGWVEAVTSGGLGVLVLVAAGRGRWLTLGGVGAALLVGGAVWVGTGLPGLLPLAAFLVSASLLTRLGGAERPVRGRGMKAGARSARQVLANGGVAAACALIGLAGAFPAAQYAVLGAVSAATADTWATELGTAAGGVTRRFGTWETVAPGRSGGVSVEGSLGGALGAAVIGLLAWPLFGSPGAFSLVCALVSGVSGMWVDSFLGAAVEDRIRWVDNEVVNLCGTLAGAMLAWGLAR